MKEEDGNCSILGHNVYSVVLFQLIGTILSAFVRLKNEVTITVIHAHGMPVTSFTPLLHVHMLTMSKYISKC